MSKLMAYGKELRQPGDRQTAGLAESEYNRMRIEGVVVFILMAFLFALAFWALNR